MTYFSLFIAQFFFIYLFISLYSNHSSPSPTVYPHSLLPMDKGSHEESPVNGTHGLFVHPGAIPIHGLIDPLDFSQRP